MSCHRAGIVFRNTIACIALLVITPAAYPRSCPQPVCPAGNAESGFLAAQEIALNSASIAFRKMAQRHGSAPDHAPLFREIGDLELEIGALERILLKNLQLSDRDKYRERLNAAKLRMSDAQTALGKTPGESLEAFAGEALGFEEVQGLLDTDEALIFFYSAADAVYIWVITADAPATWHREPIERIELRRKIEALRVQLDPFFSARTGAPVGIDRFPGTDAEIYRIAAESLFSDLFLANWEILKSKREWIIVPSGPLLSLSFPALPIPPGASEPEGAWLGLEKAISILPTLSAMRAFRCAPQEGTECRSSGKDRRFDTLIAVGSPKLTASTIAEANCVQEGSDADSSIVSSAALMGLSEIPGARKEIDDAAKVFGAGSSLVLQDASATETGLRSLNLETADILLFPTHGLLGDEVPGIPEPGLVFTPPCLQSPPRTPSFLDDGFLSASEVLRLKISAELVLLTACNTASGLGSQGEGLSGLASAFFHAGAKSLLVTHWQIDDEATRLFAIELISQMKSDGGRSAPSEYARRAARVLFDKGEKFTHPSVWGPFMIIGIDEGGSGSGP